MAEGAIDDLTHVLDREAAGLSNDGKDDHDYGCRLLRDNAQRLIETLDMADPFLRGTSPTALELGAGPLYTISALRWKYGNRISLFAVDHPLAIHPTIPEEAERGGITFAACDLVAEELPWPDERFDLILLAEVIEHLPPTELVPLLQRIGQRLAPAGALVMSSPNPAAISNILSLAIGNGEMLAPPIPGPFGTYGHIRMYSRGEIAKLVMHAGMTLHAWRMSNWPHTDPWPGAPRRDRVRLAIQRHVPKLVPRWSGGWICSATLAM